VHDEIVAHVPEELMEDYKVKAEWAMLKGMKILMGEDIPVRVEGYFDDTWSK
jgi:DNA polymerase I-like protein with 3'-5' exonuclease and polymerase domains